MSPEVRELGGILRNPENEKRLHLYKDYMAANVQ